MTGAEVLVLACDHLAACGVEPAALERGLEQRCAPVRLRTAAGVCGDARALPEATAGAERAVLALCARRPASAVLQTALRRAGLDPLGVPLVPVAARCAAHPPDVAAARAEVLIAGGVARARAFRGSRPEHLRLRAARIRTRRSLLLADLAYEPVAAVVGTRCAATAGCALCVAACPAGAIARDDGRVVVERSRCDACGACVAACPREAIELPAYRGEELWAEIDTLLTGPDGALGPRGIAFVCRHVELAGEAAGWLPVEVPSLRLLDATWVVRCFDAGASAVAVVECERCVDETVRAGVVWCSALLEAIGSQDRARLIPAGSPELAASPPPLDRAPRSSESFPGAAAAVLSLVGSDRSMDGADLAGPGSPFGRVSVDAERCTMCGACAKACPTGALALAETERELALTLDHACCVACSSCARACPEGAGVIEVVRATSLALLREGPVPLARDVQARCIRCGGPIAPGTMLGRVAALLGDEHAHIVPTLFRYCSTCRLLAGPDEPPVDIRSAEVPHARG